MKHSAHPILVGPTNDSDVDESMVEIAEGSIREAVDSVARKQGYDGYQVLPKGKIFIQSISGSGANREYVYPVGAGVSLSYDYVNNRELISPEAFFVLRTDVPLDPVTAQGQDIVNHPIRGSELTGWLWSYWMMEEDPDLVVLDNSHPTG